MWQVEQQPTEPKKKYQAAPLFSPFFSLAVQKTFKNAFCQSSVCLLNCLRSNSKTALRCRTSAGGKKRDWIDTAYRVEVKPGSSGNNPYLNLSTMSPCPFFGFYCSMILLMKLPHSKVDSQPERLWKGRNTGCFNEMTRGIRRVFSRCGWNCFMIRIIQQIWVIFRMPSQVLHAAAGAGWL